MAKQKTYVLVALNCTGLNGEIYNKYTYKLNEETGEKDREFTKIPASRFSEEQLETYLKGQDGMPFIEEYDEKKHGSVHINKSGKIVEASKKKAETSADDTAKKAELSEKFLILTGAESVPGNWGIPKLNSSVLDILRQMATAGEVPFEATETIEDLEAKLLPTVVSKFKEEFGEEVDVEGKTIYEIAQLEPEEDEDDSDAKQTGEDEGTQ